MFGTLSFLRSSRPSFVLAVAACLLLPSSSFVYAQDESQPYMVYVDQEGVSARCGPGGQYYRTDPLRHGQALEVYVETNDGWLGVRPPEGSFCWLPADVVKLGSSQNAGIVTEENSLAWIGTHLGKANKYLWQVQLSKGEEVAILGRAKRDGPDGPKLWFRIVPPAGEFRWIHRDQVVDNPELLLRKKPPAKEGLAEAPSTSGRELAGDQRHHDYYKQADDEQAETGIRQAAASLPLPTAPADRLATGRSATSTAELDVIGSGIAPVPETAMPGNDKPAAQSYDNEALHASSESVARPYEAPLAAFTTLPMVRSIESTDEALTPLGNAIADAFDRRPGSAPALATASRSAALSHPHAVLAESSIGPESAVIPASNRVPLPKYDEQNIDSLQLELSRLMSRSAPANEVDPLLSAAIRMSGHDENEVDRQRAAMMVQRAQQYQAVARRRDGATANPVSMIAPPGYPEPIQPAVAATLQQDQDAPQEAAGYLVQVFSSRPDSPPFALTDNQGRTIYYVSPAPGVNLRRYLNQSVTVHGAAGYSTGLDTPHMIATGAVRSADR